jgi:hypothetical protein
MKGKMEAASRTFAINGVDTLWGFVIPLALFRTNRLPGEGDLVGFQDLISFDEGQSMCGFCDKDAVGLENG